MSTQSNIYALNKASTIPANDLRPLVTVVVPTYNRCLFLKEAIDSVLAQTYTNWELIIVDDGSTDNTSLLLRSIFDERVKLISIPHCGNIAMVRNIGVQSGCGEWIAFLDSDDVWVAQKLEVQLAALQKSKKPWCYGGFKLMNETGAAIPLKSGTYYPYSGWIIRKVITYEASVTTCAVILQRSLFDEIGGFNADAGLFCHEDYEFILRLAMRAEALALASVVVYVRDHPGRTTSTFTNGAERTAYVYKLFYSICNKDLKALTQQQYAYHLAEAAEKNMYQKNYFRAIKYFAIALIKGDNTRHLLASFIHGFTRHQLK